MFQCDKVKGILSIAKQREERVDQREQAEMKQ